MILKPLGILFLLFAIVGAQTVLGQDETKVKPRFPNAQVLLLNSYHPQYAWSRNLTNGVSDTFRNQIPEENLHIEFMDGRRFQDDKEYAKLIKQIIKHKYQGKYKFDLIISTDDYAFDFLQEYRSEIFNNAPVVFGGVNTDIRDSIKDREHFTGILEGVGITENIELIKKLHPNVEKIIMISDKGELGKRLSNEAIRLVKGIEYEIYDDFTYQELEEKLQTLEKNHIPLLLAVHQDNQGRYFSYTKDLAPLSEISARPIYGMWGVINGHGVIGGMMNHAYLHGEEIAKYGLRVLGGTDPLNMEIKPKTVFSPQFDYNILVRFNIPLSDLPKDSLILNRPISLYEKHAPVINTAAVILLLMFISNLLLRGIIKKRTKELERSKKRMNEFIGIVAHDLRSPIGSIISLADFLKGLPDELQEVVNLMTKSANKSLKLINDMLDISAIEQGKISLKKESFDLSEVVNSVLTEVSFNANDKGVNLIVDFEAGNFVNADKKRIEQVFQNLLTNAIKFTNKGGEIEIKITDDIDEVEVLIKDDGIGMPQDIIQTIFSKSDSFSREGTSGEQGTGFGLPLVYKLIKLHGHKLKVESIESVGTIFSFKLSKA